MNENIKAGADIHSGDGGYSIGTRENYDAFAKVRNKSLAEARIKRLAQQAGIHPTNFEPDADLAVPLAAFADLIVKECADFVQFYYKDHACEGIARDMKTHFGVEE